MDIEDKNEPELQEDQLQKENHERGKKRKKINDEEEVSIYQFYYYYFNITIISKVISNSNIT